MAFVINGRILSYGSAAIAGIIALIVFMLPTTGIWEIIKILVSVLGFISALLVILFYRYGYIIIPFITKKTNIRTPLGMMFEIPPTQDVIVGTLDDNMYYATAFLGLRIFETAVEKSDEELTAYTRQFERAITGLRYVTKISMLIYVKDISKQRDIVQEKIYSIQYKLNREREKPDPDPIQIEKLETELAAWTNQLERLTSGNKPMAAIAYVTTTAIGVSKDHAIAMAKRQANEIKSWIDNALGVESRILTGEDLYLCFCWEYQIPKDYVEIEQQLN